MKKSAFPFLIIPALALIIYIFYPEKEKAVSFASDVKPILNKHCMSCHGGVKKSGEVSFLFEHQAMGKGESGNPTIIPHDIEGSELIKRINHENPEERMPPDSPPLTKNEINTLTKWVEQGAKWETHWAYTELKEPSIPEKIMKADLSESNQFIRNEIDVFIEEKLKEEGLSSNNEANAAELIRRVSLDLTGLPPKQSWINQFSDDDNRVVNYETLVDTLMSTSAFGERWAAHWMDLARYGDSMGFQKDPYRSIWRYKEWLIEAFNENKPFDQFTIEQIAGDLLPNPSDEQRIASAFYRNSLNNSEGGSDDEEFRVAAVLERVNTTWEVWMGTTMACVQCHDHPYDPFTMDDYYSFMAILNNQLDNDSNNDFPNYYSYPVKERGKVVKFIGKLKRNRKAINEKDLTREIQEATFPYLKAGFADKYYKATNKGSENAFLMPGGYIAFSTPIKSEFLSIKFDASSRGSIIFRDFNENEIFSKDVDPGNNSINYNGSLDLQGFRIQFSSKENKDLLVSEINFSPKPISKERELIQDSLFKIKRIPTPVMTELEGKDQRLTKKFIRGNWLSHGEEMNMEVPELLNKNDRPISNRREMAEWLVSASNPITSRVIVNRYWEQLMGKGLVKTLEDFGSQAQNTGYRKLLNYLAYQFQYELDWNFKELLKMIVTSGTYRQSSRVEPSVLANDPNNDFYSRYPRTRLSAEMIRDQALTVSGLLSDKMYGPGVMPPQPDGVWNVIRGLLKWETSKGEDKYRRALYTFWRKTSPYPSFLTFDSPSKEFCTSRRVNTNTPLQALVTLNDPVYFEAALEMAKQMVTYDTEKEALIYAYEKSVFKSPEEKILNILLEEYEANYNFYSENRELAVKIAGSDIEEPEKIAAHTMSANIIMNLDEFINKN